MVGAGTAMTGENCCCKRLVNCSLDPELQGVDTNLDEGNEEDSSGGKGGEEHGCGWMLNVSAVEADMSKQLGDLVDCLYVEKC